MRTIIKYVERADDLPLLQFYIHGAPHRRMHHQTIEAYRKELVEAAQKEKIVIPIKHPVAVSVLFIDPTSIDLDNLLTALWRAMDGKDHRKPTVLADDGLIHWIERTGKYYPQDKKK
jgi:Holliday junction resolvase RusA-like endonuclease